MIDQWAFGAFVITITVVSFILDIATRGRYRSRKLAVVFFAIGVILGLIYVFYGSRGFIS